jgi:hypothetical protein
MARFGIAGRIDDVFFGGFSVWRLDPNLAGAGAYGDATAAPPKARHSI